MAGLVPGAYVSLCNEVLQSLPLLAELRVLTAGAWHNAVLAALAAAALQARAITPLSSALPPMPLRAPPHYVHM